MVNMLRNGCTVVEYAYHKKLSLGDSILLKEYTSGKRADELMWMDGTIKSIEAVRSDKTNPNRKKYGINIQLILF